MPQSSFFNPIGLPPGAPFPGLQGRPMPGASAPPLRAYYGNIYGTKGDVEWDPSTNKASANFRAPVGDHQNQLFLNAGGYYQPAGVAGPSDYGFRLGFEKKIAPPGMTGGQLIDQVLSQDPSVQSLGIQGEGIPASVRSGILSSLSPEKLQELANQVKAAGRAAKDYQLGIVPGATKYKFGIGFGGQEQDTETPNAAEFARNYASKLNYQD